MNKFKTILTASLAAALLTLSCAPPADDEGDIDGDGGSSSGGGGGKGNSTTGTYTLIDQDDEYFSYLEPYESCEAGGTLSESSYGISIDYSINNKIMTWGDEYDIEYGDTLIFKGSSNELIGGTWTRTKNKTASCNRTRKYCIDGEWDDDYENYTCYEYDNYISLGCKENYDITKAVFTDSKVTITRDICESEQLDGQAWPMGNEGWKVKATNCNNLEVSKGKEKVTIKNNGNNTEVSSGGKTCKISEPTTTQKRAACKRSWDEYQDTDYYEDLLDELNESFYDCLREKMPEGFWVDNGDYDYCDIYPDDPECDDSWWGEGSLGKIAAKSVAKDKAKIKAKVKTKNKFMQLLKKKK